MRVKAAAAVPALVKNLRRDRRREVLGVVPGSCESTDIQKL